MDIIEELKKHPKCYYSTDLGVLLCGDCEEILLELSKYVSSKIINIDLVLTDPIWPDNTVKEFEDINPVELFCDCMGVIDSYYKTKRIAIHLGCDTDPRMLASISLPFLRVYWLRYALPGHKGRILMSGDVCYAFGEFPKSEKGRRLLRGEKTSRNNFGKEADHPCPRKLKHVQFLINDLSRQGELVLDPFIGSGTTAVACEKLNCRWIGIEISEKYCKVAKQRIKAEADQIKMDFR